MAISGGITFVGTSLEWMSSTGLYRMAFVLLACGLILFDIIAILLAYIDRMVSELYIEDDDHLISKLKLTVVRNPFIILFNILMIAMICIDLYCWIESGIPLN